MYRVEVGRSLRRLRLWLLAGLAVAVAVLPTVVLTLSPTASAGPGLFGSLRHAGLLAPLFALFLIQGFFLPLAVGLLAGDAVAGEATSGMLRYLLIRPIGRSWLLLAKYLAVVTLLAAGLVLLLVVGGAVGGAAFGFGPVPTLSGDVVSAGSASLRIVAAAAYVLASMAALGAVGLFFSVLTDSGPGATVATVSFLIASQILGALAALHRIHPYLLSDRLGAWTDLFRSPIAWDQMAAGLVLFGGYVVVFLGAALAVFTRRDLGS